MAINSCSRDRTRRLLLEHYKRYPKLQAEDIFKFLFQSSYGCEHLVSNPRTAQNYIEREYESMSHGGDATCESLDGAYSRVHLSVLSDGLSAETFARLFCLSAKKEDGREGLELKLDVAKELVESGEIDFDKADFNEKLEMWRAHGCQALHHSDAFRAEYHPAYRVIANKYAKLLPVLLKIDRLVGNGRAIIAVEGGSASGKTTLAGALAEVYDCNVFHMDDFFLRPEQRSAERLSEIGGNVDRERFLEEVLLPTKESKDVILCPFDCSKQCIGESITVAPKMLTVVEGAYSMHPELSEYYDCSIYLEISPELQKERILKRNSPQFAKRFFDEWIPLERIYFDQTDIGARCSCTISSESLCFND